MTESSCSVFRCINCDNVQVLDQHDSAAITSTLAISAVTACSNFPPDLKITASIHYTPVQRARTVQSHSSREIPAPLARTMYPSFVHANISGLFPAEIHNSPDEIDQMLPLISCLPRTVIFNQYMSHTYFTTVFDIISSDLIRAKT